MDEFNWDRLPSVFWIVHDHYANKVDRNFLFDRLRCDMINRVYKEGTLASFIGEEIRNG